MVWTMGREVEGEEKRGREREPLLPRKVFVTFIVYYV